MNNTDFEDDHDGFYQNGLNSFISKNPMGEATRLLFGSEMSLFKDEYERLLSLTQSPIEEKFFHSLVLSGIGYGKPLFTTHNDEYKKDPPIDKHIRRDLYIYPQKNFNFNNKKYRADFFITSLGFKGSVSGGECVYKIIVECDGHDFHEKTKEQAKRDKLRDRTFTSHGISVFRFTGSEIHKNAESCAEEVLHYLDFGPRRVQ